MAFSASDAAFEGFRVARRAPLAVAIWALAYIVFTAICFALVGGSFAALMQAASDLEGVTDPTPEMLQPFFSAYLGMLWMLPLGLAFGAVLYAAVNRAVLSPAQKGFGYMRLGMDEVRVFVVTLVLTILAMIAAVLVFGLAGVVIGFASAALGDLAGLIGVIVVAAAIALFIWLILRFSLAVPITVAERKLAIFDSWKVTKGHALGLFGMTLIVIVMTIVVYILLSLIFAPMWFFGGGSMTSLFTGDPLEMAEMMRTLGPLLAMYVVFNGVTSALAAVLLYAPYAAAYRDITGGGVATLAQAEVTH